MRGTTLLRGVVGGMVLAASVSAAASADLAFCWKGAAGWTMEGRITYPDALDHAQRVTEADVTRFEIAGYHDGRPAGHWSMDQVRPETRWRLNFYPPDRRFGTGGLSAGPMGQQWNAGSFADDCGAGGFGFNAGAGMQDLCVDGQWIVESGIAAATPLVAQSAQLAAPCVGVSLLARPGGHNLNLRRSAALDARRVR